MGLTYSYTADVLPSHGDSYTITGSGFGTKSPAAPLVFDDGSGADIETNWGLADGSAISDYKVDYRTPAEVTALKNSGSAASLPHSNITHYIAGGHYDISTGGSTNRNKGVIGPDIGENAKVYWHYLYRADPDWFDSGGDANHKMWQYASGSRQMYPSFEHFYGNPNGGSFGGSSTWDYDVSYPVATNAGFMSGHCHTTEGGDIIELDSNLINWYSAVTSAGGNGTQIGSCNLFSKQTSTNPKAAWIQIEHRNQHGSDGVHDYYQDNVQRWWVRLNDDDNNRASTSRYESIGGYSRDHGTSNSYKNNWRYFADVYFDNTWARVMLHDAATLSASTITAPQPPTSWSDTSITVTLNKSRLSSGTVYYTVIDANNSEIQTGSLEIA